MSEVLGRCDKKEYEHRGLHPRYGSYCINWQQTTPLADVEEDKNLVSGASDYSQIVVLKDNSLKADPDAGKSAAQIAHEDSYWDDPLRGTNKC